MAKAHPGEEGFAGLLRRYVREKGASKAALARAIGTTRQYIREVETGRKPPPTLAKVEVLADTLGLEPAERAAFLRAARIERSRPEVREYLARLERALEDLAEIFGLRPEEREAVWQGEPGVLVRRIEEALREASPADPEAEPAAWTRVLRYRQFVDRLLRGLESLREHASDQDVAWVQEELLRQVERLVGLRRSEAGMLRRLGSSGRP